MNEFIMLYKQWRQTDYHAKWLMSGNDMFSGFMNWLEAKENKE